MNTQATELNEFLKQAALKLELPETTNLEEFWEALKKLKEDTNKKVDVTVRQPLKVMLVDDNKKLGDEFMNNNNFQIDIRRTAKGIVEDAKNYNVILLDLELPDGEKKNTLNQLPRMKRLYKTLHEQAKLGMERLPAITKENPEVKVFIYSNHATGDLVESAQAGGAVGYIYKNESGDSDIYLMQILNEVYEGLENERDFYDWSSDTIKIIMQQVPPDDDEGESELQKKVLEMLAAGYEANAIEKIIQEQFDHAKVKKRISDKGVYRITAQLSRLWNVPTNQTAIVIKAIQNNIISLENITVIPKDNSLKQDSSRTKKAP